MTLLYTPSVRTELASATINMISEGQEVGGGRRVMRPSTAFDIAYSSPSSDGLLLLAQSHIKNTFL